MDVRELERWSRADLDREGRRIGIYRPEALSRSELERRVREHHRTPAARVIGRARGVFGRVLGLARTLASVASLPPPSQPATPPPRAPATTGRAWAVSASERPSDSEAAAVATESTETVIEAAAVATESTEAPVDTESAAVATESTETVTGAAPTEAATTEAATTEAAMGALASREPETSSAMSMESETLREPETSSAVSMESETLREPETSDATTAAATSTEAVTSKEGATDPEMPEDELDALVRAEPIPTRRMAQILAKQGHQRRALAIYRKLLRAAPHDDALRAEAVSLGADEVALGVDAVALGEADDDDESDRDECVAVPLRAGEALVAWHVSEGALRRARSLVGDQAALVLRAIVLDLGEGGAPRRRVQEESVSAAGERMLQLEGRSRVVAAVGVRAGDRFVSIAHAPALEVGEPSR